MHPTYATNAATKIQSVWRGHSSRRAFKQISRYDIVDDWLQNRNLDDIVEQVILIQALWRGLLGRRKALWYRYNRHQQLVKWEQEQTHLYYRKKAARWRKRTLIPPGYKGFRHSTKMAAAIAIQTAWRAHAARNVLRIHRFAAAAGLQPHSMNTDLFMALGKVQLNEFYSRQAITDTEKSGFQHLLNTWTCRQYWDINGRAFWAVARVIMGDELRVRRRLLEEELFSRGLVTQHWGRKKLEVAEEVVFVDIIHLFEHQSKVVKMKELSALEDIREVVEEFEVLEFERRGLVERTEERSREMLNQIHQEAENSFEVSKLETTIMEDWSELSVSYQNEMDTLFKAEERSRHILSSPDGIRREQAVAKFGILDAEERDRAEIVDEEKDDRSLLWISKVQAVFRKKVVGLEYEESVKRDRIQHGLERIGRTEITEAKKIGELLMFIELTGEDFLRRGRHIAEKEAIGRAQYETHEELEKQRILTQEETFRHAKGQLQLEVMENGSRMLLYRKEAAEWHRLSNVGGIAAQIIKCQQDAYSIRDKVEQEQLAALGLLMLQQHEDRRLTEEQMRYHREMDAYNKRRSQTSQWQHDQQNMELQMWEHRIREDMEKQEEEEWDELLRLENISWGDARVAWAKREKAQYQSALVAEDQGLQLLASELWNTPYSSHPPPLGHTVPSIAPDYSRGGTPIHQQLSTTTFTPPTTAPKDGEEAVAAATIVSQMELKSSAVPTGAFQAPTDTKYRSKIPQHPEGVASPTLDDASLEAIAELSVVATELAADEALARDKVRKDEVIAWIQLKDRIGPEFNKRQHQAIMQILRKSQQNVESVEETSRVTKIEEEGEEWSSMAKQFIRQFFVIAKHDILREEWAMRDKLENQQISDVQDRIKLWKDTRTEEKPKALLAVECLQQKDDIYSDFLDYSLILYDQIQTMNIEATKRLRIQRDQQLAILRLVDKWKKLERETYNEVERNEAEKRQAMEMVEHMQYNEIWSQVEDLNARLGELGALGACEKMETKQRRELAIEEWREFYDIETDYRTDQGWRNGQLVSVEEVHARVDIMVAEEESREQVEVIIRKYIGRHDHRDRAAFAKEESVERRRIELEEIRRLEDLDDLKCVDWKAARAKLEERSATIIQAGQRGMVGRKRVLSRKRDIKKAIAATKLQAWVRGELGRRRAKQRAITLENRRKFVKRLETIEALERVEMAEHEKLTILDEIRLDRTAHVVTTEEGSGRRQIVREERALRKEISNQYFYQVLDHNSSLRIKQLMKHTNAAKPDKHIKAPFTRKAPWAMQEPPHGTTAVYGLEDPYVQSPLLSHSAPPHHLLDNQHHHNHDHTDTASFDSEADQLQLNTAALELDEHGYEIAGGGRGAETETPAALASSVSLFAGSSLQGTAHKYLVKTPAQRRLEREHREATAIKESNTDLCNQIMEIMTTSLTNDQKWGKEMERLKNLEHQAPTLVNAPTLNSIYTTTTDMRSPKSLAPLSVRPQLPKQRPADPSITAIEGHIAPPVVHKAANRIDEMKQYARQEPLKGQAFYHGEQAVHYNINYKWRHLPPTPDYQGLPLSAPTSRASSVVGNLARQDSTLGDPRKQRYRRASQFEVRRIDSLAKGLLASMGNLLQGDVAFQDGIKSVNL